MNRIMFSLGLVREMADRRKQQNYTQLPHFLTDGLWRRLETLPRHEARVSLIAHAFDLGLRCPSEQTFGILQNLLALAGPEKERPQSSFERYNAIQTLKKMWKEFKNGREDQDHQYSEYLFVLPRLVEQLPPECYAAAFSLEPPVECRSWTAMICKAVVLQCVFHFPR